IRDARSFDPADAGDALFDLDSNDNRLADAGDAIFVFGRINDGFVIGDWNGDGTSKVGVYRDGTAAGAPGTALFSLDTNGNRQFDPGVDTVFLFGRSTDQFVAANWAATPPLQPAEFAANGRGTGAVAPLTSEELAPVVQQALANWAAHGANVAPL